ncbi:MAG: GntR family transcriptional regulator [Candidatus Competibacteraceae bacterium]|nr:GntR family transcriptional regulator [Candidatus Competibacteraceae bacterium]
MNESMTPIEPIKRGKSLTDQALAAIRAKIVSGQWRLGEALSEIAIAAELGVSKTRSGRLCSTSSSKVWSTSSRKRAPSFSRSTPTRPAS